MDITQVDVWQRSTARPRPPGNAVSGDARGRAVVITVQITKGRMRPLVIKLAMISPVMVAMRD
jgi:hypothetical protein